MPGLLNRLLNHGLAFNSWSEVVLAGRDRVGFPFHCRNAPFFCWYNATLYNNRAFILVPDSSHKLEKNDKLAVPWLHISAYVVVAGSWRALARNQSQSSKFDCSLGQTKQGKITKKMIGER